MRTLLLRLRACAVPILAALVAGLATLSAMPVRAQQGYPSRPVQLVVAFEPGNSGDPVAGLLAQGLPSAVGQPVAVEHRPGASGAVGPGASRERYPTATRSSSASSPRSPSIRSSTRMSAAIPNGICSRSRSRRSSPGRSSCRTRHRTPRLPSCCGLRVRRGVACCSPPAAPVRAGTWRPNCSASGPRAGSSTSRSRAPVRR